MKLAATLIPALILSGSVALAQSEGTADAMDGMDHGAMEGMEQEHPMPMSDDPELLAAAIAEVAGRGG